MRLLAAIGVLAFGFAQPAVGAPSEADLRRDWSRRIDAGIAHRQYAASDIDKSAALDEGVRRWRASGDAKDMRAWVFSRMFEAGFGDVTYGARPDPNARYAIPMQWRIPRLLTNGVGTYTHKDEQHHCFDFLTRIGDPIVAAREGTVVQVVDGHPNGVDTFDSNNSNKVVVKHVDGTFALYLHLSPRIPVREGQRVKRRERIAASGYSGGGNGEHLHFCVHRFDDEGLVESVPVRFGPPASKGFVPAAGRFYGPKIVPTPNLRLSVDGVAVDPKKPLRLPRGAAVRLHVELRSPDGGWRDVTRDPATRYEPLTLWNVAATRDGVLKLEPTDGFGHMEVAEPFGSALIFYDKGKVRARGKVTFRIE